MSGTRAMTPTKLLIGQILIVFAIVIVGVWSATQWAAAELGYQAQLGAPWVVLFGTPVYQPWKLFEWWYAYEAYAPHIFDRAGMRSEEHTSELQSLMRISYAVFCLKKKKKQ